MNAPVADIADYRYFKAFARGLREQGMEEGRNIFIARRSAEGPAQRLAALPRSSIQS
jgi:hypothetical protein